MKKWAIFALLLVCAVGAPGQQTVQVTPPAVSVPQTVQPPPLSFTFTASGLPTGCTWIVTQSGTTFNFAVSNCPTGTTTNPPPPPPPPPPVTTGACPTQIAPTGGTDNANWTAKMLAASNAGTCVEITAGNYSLQPFSAWPSLSKGLSVVCDDNAVVSDQAGFVDTLITIDVANINITGTGSANQCTFKMPNSYKVNSANSNEDTNQYAHAIEVNGGNGGSIKGIRTIQAGGDGVYIENTTVFLVDTVTAMQSIRNGCSLTNAFSKIIVQRSIFENAANPNSGLNAGCDVEPNNGAGPAGVTFINDQFLNNGCSSCQISNGLRISLQNLSSSTPGVAISIVSTIATGNFGGANYHLVLPSSVNGKVPSTWSLTGNGNTQNGAPTTFPN